MLRIALYESETNPSPLAVDLSWEDLVSMLSEISPTECQPCIGKACSAKRGEGWSPVDIVGNRSNDNVQSVTVAVFDLDHMTVAQLQELAPRIAEYSWIMHSTHNHRPPSDCCLRLVMELSRPVAAVDWRRFLRNIINVLKIPADPSCKDVSRIYFLPRAPKGNETSIDVNFGKPIDVDSILNLAVESSPYNPTPVPIDLAELRIAIRQAARGRRATKHSDPLQVERKVRQGDLLWNLSYGKPFCVGGDFVGETDLPKGRDAALNELLSSLVWVIPVETPWETVAELLRPSLMPVAAPEGINHWLTEGEDQWQRAVERRRDFQVEKAAENKRIASAFEQIINPVAEKPVVVAPVTDAPTSADDGPWIELLIADPNSKGKGWRSCSSNVGLILEFAEGVGGFVKWNDVTRDIVVTGGIFASTPTQTLATVVTGWLQRKWGVYVNTAVTKECLLAVARKHTIDPLRDYLEGLTWDGSPRLDTWLEVFCDVETIDADGEDITEWVRRIAARWAIAAVARALDPGCKVDTVLILEGRQNLGKSSLFAALGGQWFVDDKINLGDKDSKMLASQTWICELAELASLHKSETETQKAFLTQRKDKFRPPYGAVMEEFPRRCIFVGTVNVDEFDDGYLRDRTGNRRYWPVRCTGALDVKGIAEARDQLFAEAVVRYKAGERWWFDHLESEAFERAVTNSRVEREPDSLAEAIRFWWSTTLQQRPAELTLRTIAIAVGLDIAKITRTDETRLGRVLKQLGFDRHRRRTQSGREYYYVGPPVDEGASRVSATVHAIATTKTRGQA